MNYSPAIGIGVMKQDMVHSPHDILDLLARPKSGHFNKGYTTLHSRCLKPFRPEPFSKYVYQIISEGFERFLFMMVSLRLRYSIDRSASNQKSGNGREDWGTVRWKRWSIELAEQLR